MPTARALAALIVLASTLAAGCVSPALTQNGTTAAPKTVDELLPIQVSNVLNFTESVVTPAVGTATDFYEPTMEISDTGTMYVTAHVAGAATTGSPAYFSTDHGATWKQLPFAGPAA